MSNPDTTSAPRYTIQVFDMNEDLPLSAPLTDDQADEICHYLAKFFGGRRFTLADVFFCVVLDGANDEQP